MKAYIVSCHDDDHGSCVVFANTRNEARRMGNGDQCDCAYFDRTARRDKELDRFAPGPVSLKWLVENHGWYTFCQQCERQLHEGDAVWMDDNTAECKGHGGA